MKRVVIHAPSFVRAARRYLKKHPDAETSLIQVIRDLAADAFAPHLRTHKLKGKLAEQWASRGGYDLRIIFQLVKDGDDEMILLLSVGTHDEVY